MMYYNIKLSPMTCYHHNRLILFFVNSLTKEINILCLLKWINATGAKYFVEQGEGAQ